MCYMFMLMIFGGWFPKCLSTSVIAKYVENKGNDSGESLEWIFFKDPEGGVGREAAPSEELFFPNQAVQGWIAMMASAKDHEISRK